MGLYILRWQKKGGTCFKHIGSSTWTRVATNAVDRCVDHCGPTWSTTRNPAIKGTPQYGTTIPVRFGRGWLKSCAISRKACWKLLEVWRYYGSRQKVPSNTGVFSTTISKDTHYNQNGVIIKMTDPKLDMFLVFLSFRTPLATSPVVNFDLANPLKFPDLGYLGCFRATILPSCRVKPPTMVAGYLTCLQLKSFFETGAAWTKHEYFIL